MLGLSWDDDVVYQSSNIERHQSVVNSMIENGTAYRCFLTKEELDSLRQKSEQIKFNNKFSNLIIEKTETKKVQEAYKEILSNTSTYKI